MPELIVVKVLQPSDLTLFDVIWQRDNRWFRDGQIAKLSKQKAINLNAREFLNVLYLRIREAAERGVTRVPLI